MVSQPFGPRKIGEIASWLTFSVGHAYRLADLLSVIIRRGVCDVEELAQILELVRHDAFPLRLG